jgi:hypothetical protein
VIISKADSSAENEKGRGKEWPFGQTFLFVISFFKIHHKIITAKELHERNIKKNQAKNEDFEERLVPLAIRESDFSVYF